MKKAVGLGIVMVLVWLAMSIPAVVAVAIGMPAAAAALILPVMAGLMPAMMTDLRTALMASGVLTIASFLGVLAHEHANAAGLIMAVTALIVGVSARWGHSKNLILVPITVGFVLCSTPSIQTDTLSNAVALGILTLVGALWGTAAGWFIGRRIPHTPPKEEAWNRTWAYAITLAILTAIAVYISVSISWGHAGAWFVMTVTIVFQPYLSDAYKRTLERAGGTVIGVIAAYVLNLLVHWTWLTIVLGIVLMTAAMFVLVMGKYPYWLYTAILTPGVLLLIAGNAADFRSTDLARLVATFAGAALSLAAVALLTPAYRAEAKKHGADHY